VVVAVAAIGLGTAAPAFAQQPLDPAAPDAAQEALAGAEAALAPDGGPVASPEPTLALNALAAALSELEGADRERAHDLLARPTDGADDQYGDGFAPGAPVASAASAHFCVSFISDPGFADAPNLTDANGAADGDGTPDYVEAILEIAEFSRSVEVAPGPLGWSPPKPDAESCGADPSAHADIYLKQLGNAGIFGYESPDPGQGQGRSRYGYMVLDNDYATSEYGFPEPLDAAKVTFAHEFNHLLQQNYDSLQDVWMFEATAVWVEEQVYPEINDYVNYVGAFASSPGAPITDGDAAQGLKIYGSAVWNHWLSGPGGGFGVGAVRRAWEVSNVVDPADFAPSAYDRAIRDAGGRGFSREFLRFAVATGEWRTGFGGFPDAALYPDVKRKGSVSAGQAKELTLDHTAFRLLDVHNAGSAQLELTVRAEDGVRAGFALVARSGDPVGGTVTKQARYLDGGGKATVTLESPGDFDRITAAIVNADGRAKGFNGNDWFYRKENQEFTVALK
jgi:hypothetical protein